jgi:hypothetical protein
MPLSRIKLTGLALVVSAMGVSSTIRAQGTACPPAGTNACSAGGSYSCNAVRQVGTYQAGTPPVTCTIFQSCNVNCPATGTPPNYQCPSWGATWVEPGGAPCL